MSRLLIQAQSPLKAGAPALNEVPEPRLVMTRGTRIVYAFFR